MTDSSLLHSLPEVNLSSRRCTELSRALANCATLRQHMVNGRATIANRDEQELRFMLSLELAREFPRRSVLKRLHGAINTRRQRREWAALSQEARTP